MTATKTKARATKPANKTADSSAPQLPAVYQPGSEVVVDAAAMGFEAPMRFAQRETTNTKGDIVHDIMIRELSERFPLGHTPAGKWNGRVINIGDYCIEKTKSTQHPHGMCWSKAQSDKLFEKHPELGRLPVCEDKALRKQMSAELDSIRKNFYDAAKPHVVSIATHAQTQVQSIKFTPTKNGLRVTTGMFIQSKKTSEVELLRAELDATRKKMEEIAALVPPAALKRMKKAGKPLDVESSTDAGTPPESTPVTPV